MEKLHTECSRWFLTDRPQVNGVVLLAHGLNQRPSKWSELIDYLNSLGLHVYRLALTGHRGLPFADMKTVSTEIWKNEMAEACLEVKKRSLQLPVFLIAYSLGGLLSSIIQLQTGRPLFDRQILIAPALAIRAYTRLAIPLCGLLTFLPSRSPKGYVANSEGTTSEAYRALFQLEKELRITTDFSVLNIPTRVLMRSDDELISYRGTKRFLREKRLDRWQLLTLDEAVSGRKPTFSFKHLIIDKRSAGEEIWLRISSEISGFFIDNYLMTEKNDDVESVLAERN